MKFAMSLPEAVREFERGFELVLDGPPMAYIDAVPQRLIYGTICSGGEKSEGAETPALFQDEAKAIEAWLHAADAWRDERRGKYLYWRHRPTIEWGKCPAFRKAGETGNYCYVYSRFVASDVVVPTIAPAEPIVAGPRGEANGDVFVTCGGLGFRISRLEWEDGLENDVFRMGMQHLRQAARR